VDADVVEAVVGEIRAAGGAATGVVAAVGGTGAADELVRRALSEFGRLDVMVTNAGLLRDATIGKMSDDAFDTVIRTHLRGTFTCARAAYAQFRQQGDGGRLILVGSPAGQRASFGQANYAAAKAGIVGMTRTLAAEGRKYGIAANAIIPAALTRMIASIPGMSGVVDAVEAGQPVPEKLRVSGIGTAQDVAPLVVFLASLDATVTGQCFGIGGDRLSLWSHPHEVAVTVRPGGWTLADLAKEFPAALAPHLQEYLPAPHGTGDSAAS
jgi:NAD(P)-dependent dehydrogenase (short-subunit alcohol dehydrogenase family)